MTARRGTLIRAACVALALLFAARAVAGAVLCDLYGEHPVPPSAAVSSPVHRAVTDAPHGHHADDQRPAGDRSDHACDEPVYLTGASVSAPAKSLLALDSACTHVACAVSPPRVAAAAVALRQQQTHPPRSISPLDVSPRLRI